MLHLPAVELKENEYIIHCLPYLKDIMGKSGSLELDGKTYKCSDIYTEDFFQYDGYGNGQEVLIVVEDEALNHSDILYSLFAANLSESDSLTSLNALLQQFPSLEMLDVNFVTGETSDTGSTMTRLTSYDSDYLNGRFVIFASRLEVMLIMSLFSLGFMLFVVCAVIFAIRQLDDLRSSQRGFRILSILGMNRKDILCLLKKQVFLNFLLLALPVVVIGSGLVYIVSQTVISLYFMVPVYNSILPFVLKVYGATVILFLVIYGIYGMVTYYTAKKGVLSAVK